MVETMKNFIDNIKNIAIGIWSDYLESWKDVSVSKYVTAFIFSLIIFFVGKKLIHIAVKMLKKTFERSRLEEGVAGFLIAFIRAALYVLLVVFIARIMGLGASSIVAVIGSAGLTLGLALQGSLSNFAGGVLILILKPFSIGDYIVAGSNEGSVVGIDIFYTKLLTADNKMVVMPNGALSNMNITNVTKEPIRRLDLVVPVAHSANIYKVKELLFEIASSSELVLREKEEPGEVVLYGVEVFVISLEQSSINMGFRLWVKTEDYWTLKWEMLEKIKDSLEREKIEIPNSQVDVHVIQR